MKCSAATTAFACLVAVFFGSPTHAKVDPAESWEVKSVAYTGGEYKNETFKYRLLKPTKVEAGKRYPVILFLHGAGERGSDNYRQLVHFCLMMTKPEYRKQFPCYIVAPQCRTNKKWVNVSWSPKASIPMPKQPSDQMKVAIMALQKTIVEEQVDLKRVHVTGLSMGGYGTWDLAARHTDWFASASPICGGGDERVAKRYIQLPLWAHHGDKDGAVPVERSRTMIAAIKAVGGKPKYTEYKGKGHNVWTPAYSDRSDKGLLTWIFAQKRKTPAKIKP